MVWEGYTPDSIVKPFEKQTGVKINPTYISNVNQQISKLVAGGTDQYDIVMATSDIGRTLAEAKVIKPLDVSRLENYDDLFDYTKTTYDIDDQIWAVSQAWGINPFLYNSDDFKKPPTSLDVQWSPEMKGKLGLWDDYTLIYMGATVLGMDDPPGVFDLSDEQLDQIKDKMLELKPNVRTIWTSGGDLIQKFSTGEVSGSLGWNYIYQQLHPKGFPIEQVVFKHQGPQGWNDANAISAGIDPECEDAAYDWIDYVDSPKAQAAMAKETGYSAANPKATKYMSKELINETYMNDPESYQKRAFIRTDPVRREKYIQVAQEIVQGLN
jgi:putative spermidine/putrescine transport system substrate-binding protein/spermidine/putrescine transport system substrate-binding protein